jgi:hypothetical protein
MNQHKTKVIALRVTEEEELYLRELRCENGLYGWREFFEQTINEKMVEARVLIKRRQKAAEAKAKRLAKKEAQNVVH